MKWNVKRTASNNIAKQYKVVDDGGNTIFLGELNQCSRAAAAHNAMLDGAHE